MGTILATVVVGASRPPTPEPGHGGKKPRADPKPGWPEPSPLRTSLWPPERGGPTHPPARGGHSATSAQAPAPGQGAGGGRGKSSAPSLPHPGPGRAGAVRVSRRRAANKVAVRGSAATAPGSAPSRPESECGARRGPAGAGAAGSARTQLALQP